jgi:hypothetical protein
MEEFMIPNVGEPLQDITPSISWGVQETSSGDLSAQDIEELASGTFGIARLTSVNEIHSGSDRMSSRCYLRSI